MKAALGTILLYSLGMLTSGKCVCQLHSKSLFFHWVKSYFCVDMFMNRVW